MPELETHKPSPRAWTWAIVLAVLLFGGHATRHWWFPALVQALFDDIPMPGGAWGCPRRSPRVLTARHTVDCAYTHQELQALFRLAHEADMEKGGRYVVRTPCDRLHSPPR